MTSKHTIELHKTAFQQQLRQSVEFGVAFATLSGKVLIPNTGDIVDLIEIDRGNRTGRRMDGLTVLQVLSGREYGIQPGNYVLQLKR